MFRIMNGFFHRYCSSQEAATAIEYGLIACGISLAIVSAVFVFGDNLETLFTDMQPAIDAIAAEAESSR